MAAEQQTESKGVAAVERALTIMSVFLKQEEPLRLAEISAATGLYKSTILRLMTSLEQFGYIRRLADGRYQIGATPFALGRAYQSGFRLADHVVPVLRRLVAEGTESTSFHVREGDSRVVLHRVNSGHSTLDRVAEGDLLPLDRGGPGRVILAFSGESGARYDAIRRNFHAVSYGERDGDCASVAAPVFGSQNAIIGALSSSGPRSRFSEERTEWLTAKIVAAAAELTTALGGDARRFPSTR